MAKSKKKTVKKAVKAKKPTAKKAIKVKKPTKVLAKKAKPTKSVKVAKAKGKAVGQKSAPKKVAKPNLNFWKSFLTPLDDRLIVDIQDNQEKVTAGGIIIPDTATVEGNFKGLVLAVGRGHRDGKGKIRPMDVKAGDRILFTEHAGSKIKVMDQDLMILRESDVLAIED